MHGTGRAGEQPEIIAEVAAALLLVGAMVFGGGSRGAGDAVVHLLAIPALWLAITRWTRAEHHATATATHVHAGRAARWFAYWLTAAALLVVLQLLPIPVSLFARLPQRADVLADLQQAGMQRAWLPTTLDVWGTVRSGLALATFAAMALLAMTLSQAARRRLLTLALLLAVPMALLGFAQAAAGQAPGLRFHDYHHPMGAIGLFANRNHFADLLGMLLPFALLFAVQAQSRQQRALAMAWYALIVILMLAIALSFSRAGIALAALAVATILVLLRPQGGRSRHLMPLLAFGIAALGIATYAWSGIVDRLALDPLADLRWQYLHYGREALAAWWPVGSGFGTFRDVYAPFEPVSAMTNVHALHAHNDLLELLIEGGAMGLILLGGLIALLVGSFSKIRNSLQYESLNARRLHLACTVSCVVPLLHSLVDYPLRTLAIAVPFGLALSVALVTGPASPRHQIAG